MMKQDIFDQVGKRTPYQVPEGYFEQSKKSLQQLAGSHQPFVHRTSVRRTWMYGAAAAALLLLAVGGVWQYIQQQTPVEAVYTLDDGSYDSSWEEFAAADIFLDEMDW